MPVLGIFCDTKKGDAMKEKLEQLRALHAEIETISKKYYEMPSEEYVGDTVKNYRSGKGIPYVIRGFSSEKREKLERKLEQKLEILNKNVNELEDYLDGVADPEMRDILRLYYGVGLSHEEIAERKGYSRSAISMKLKRFFAEK